MKNILSIIFIICSFVLYSQTPQLIFGIYNAFDECIGMVELEDGSIIAVQKSYEDIYIIPEGQNYGEWVPVNRNDLPYYSFANIWHYSKNGEVIGTIPIQSSADTFYIPEKVLKMSDGKILIGGEAIYASNNNVRKVFFAILNEDGSHVEKLNILNKQNLITHWFYGIAEKSNGNIILNGIQPGYNPKRDFLVEMDRDGNIIANFYYYNLGLYNAEFGYDNKYTTMYHNDVFYKYIPNNIGLMKIDTFGTVDTFSHGIQNQYLDLNSVGKSLGSKYLIDGVKGRLLSLYSLEYDSLKIIFQDSVSMNINNYSYLTFDFVDSNHIYIAKSYPDFNIDSLNHFIIASLKHDGTLNWKKEYRVYSDSIERSIFPNVIESICATKDKGLLISFSVKDWFDQEDSYILKIDKDGNTIETFSALNGIKLKMEVVNFKIYPNPTQEKLFIEPLTKGNYNFALYNLSGNKLMSKEIRQRETIDISLLPPQTYFYCITNLDNSIKEVGKILKK